MNRILAMVALIVVVVLALFFIPWGCGDLDLESLESGQQVHGFTVENLYVDAAGKAMGARFALITATHETGHMFSMLHCTAYECCMCGSNHREESDRRPVYLCPECTACHVRYFIYIDGLS